MVESKKYLSNVAFGGAWSEEILERQALKEVIDTLYLAATECGEKDVRDRQLADALRYVRCEIEKGPMLVEGFQKALFEPLPEVREASVRRYVDLIVEWSGF